MEIVPLKKTNAQSIYSVLLDWLKKKDFQCSKLIGMGFDGAATFAGKKSGVQARLKKHAPHSVFVQTRLYNTDYIVEIFSLFAEEMPESERDTESTRHS